MDTSTWGLPTYINAFNYPIAAVMELSICMLSILLVINSFKKFIVKRNRITIEISFVFCGIFLAAFLTGLGKLLVISGIIDYSILVYVLYLDAIALMCVMISSTAFFFFVLDTFYAMTPRNRQITIIIYLIPNMIAVMSGLYALITRDPSTLLKNMLNGIILSLSLFTYLLVTIKASLIARKATGLDKAGIQMIALSGILIIAFFVFFTLDVLNLFGWGNISLFYFIAWPIAAIGILVTYIGYFRPSWFQRLVS